MPPVFVPTRQPETPRTETHGVVRELGVRKRSDEELVAELRAGGRDAGAALFERYGAAIERLLWGVLGPEPEAEDVLHEVFVRALAGIHGIDDPSRLRSWLNGIAVFTAREWIRKRTRRRWLRFVEEVPELTFQAASEEITEATRRTFAILADMRAEERVFFSLRFIEGMEMAEIAVVCDVSLSTAKRRLKVAEQHFLNRARKEPALASWIEEGDRWEVP